MLLFLDKCINKKKMEKIIKSKRKEGKIKLILIIIFTILVISLILITLKFKIEIVNLVIDSQTQGYINNKYRIIIKIYTFNKIPIFKSKINQEKIQKILSNQKIKENIEKEKTKIIENKNAIDKELIKDMKNIKPKIEKIKLNIIVGTENAALTAFIIPVISTILALALKNTLNNNQQHQFFKVQPIYRDQNLINIKLSGIIEIKMIHIINTICIVNKKRKGDKNERTSNRRSYDYSYE